MQMAGQPDAGAIVALMDMARMARHAKDSVELEFMAVNTTHALVPYRQAALWFGERQVCALSGVVQIETNAPYVHWLDRLCRALPGAGPVDLAVLPLDLAEEWHEWLPAYGLWLPLPGAGVAFDTASSSDADAASMPEGGLLLARELPWLESEVVLLTEWIDAWTHAWRARARPGRWSAGALKSRFGRLRKRDAGMPWWRRRSTHIALVAAAVLCIPVKLTVLAPGELVPANAAVVRSPLEGVIERFHVKPNQPVKKGEPLFDFDEAQLASRYAVALQALSTAEAEYRQSAQMALTESKSKAQLATLQGKIEERRADAEFLRGQVERARVLAPQDGIALFDDPSEWIGRPVATGERILRVALPDDVEVEAWVAVGDAIPLPPGAALSLYLSASPLSPVTARVRNVTYESVQRPDGSHAYRVRATLDGATAHRVGMKGTAKLSGDWVPLAYWITRRPVAAVRQTLGW